MLRPSSTRGTSAPSSAAPPAKSMFTRVVPRAKKPPQPDPPASATGKVFEPDVEQEFSDVDIETAPTRRWSTLSSRRFIYQPGTILGSSGLVAGLTIGAGILALPKTTQEAGFVPSVVTLIVFYVFSAMTGLMVLEVNANTICEQGAGAVSMQSMVKRTLGGAGAVVSSAAFLFLHYAMLVACIVRGSAPLADAAAQPAWAAAVAFALATGGLCYFASPRVLDNVNNVLLGAVIVLFVGLVGIAAPHISADSLLATASWPALVDTLPVMALAFVYQSVVPVVVSNLEVDVPKARTAILLGLLVPLVMFVGWEAVGLGTLPPGVTGKDPVDVLKGSSATMGPLVEAFSFLAIITSFIGYILGLSEFLQDALPLEGQAARAPAYALTLIPPYFLALAFPDVFFSALDKAGTYGVLVLFGVLPAAMVWSERFARRDTATRVRAMPGGRPALLAVGGLALAIVCNELVASVRQLGEH